MKTPEQIAEEVFDGELQTGDLEQLTPEQLQQAVDIAFDAEDAADEITEGNAIKDEDEDDDAGELVPA